MDLDSAPAPRDPPSFPSMSAAPRPLRANPRPGLRWEGNGLLIGGVLLLLVAWPLALGVVEMWSLPRRNPLRRPMDVLFVAGVAGWGLTCLVKGLRLRWRAR